jgi:hypothetical protein
MFTDVFTDVGRRSVPLMIVAAVMVLQRIEGRSDREAADWFGFDARWKYAARGLGFDYPGVRAHGAGGCGPGWPGRRGRRSPAGCALGLTPSLVRLLGLRLVAVSAWGWG